MRAKQHIVLSEAKKMLVKVSKYGEGHERNMYLIEIVEKSIEKCQSKLKNAIRNGNKKVTS